MIIEIIQYYYYINYNLNKQINKIEVCIIVYNIYIYI